MNKIANGLKRCAPFLFIPAILSGTLTNPRQPFTLKMPVAQAQTNAAHLYAEANPAVVTVQSGSGHGSGFVIDQTGLIITNAHVVAGGPSIVTVKLHDGRQMSADVIGYANHGVDLAALRIYDSSLLTSLTLASNTSLQVGQSIFIIGTPLDRSYNNTLLSGMISRLEPNSGILQHSANTHPGTSGAPLLNSQGKVIGVNFGGIQSPILTASGEQIAFTRSGINYALSIDHLHRFVRDLNQGNHSPNSTVAATPSAEMPNVTPLNKGTQEGTLSSSDHTIKKGYYGDFFIFKGQKQQSLQINLKSQDFDPFLILYRVTEKDGESDVELVASNDDSGPEDLNAFLDTTLPADATYLLVSMNARPHETGRYTLHVQ